ncbi:phosphatidylinositol N-acetylglucosaminyltransferase subunit C-like [Ruditapes philippinarum]|uniref:phosphatidylinositol N-acetylglucosaminyltransferase subunit C-like n=1 Tax=Ruditapes philippinarum TaxID=129788 RepID=UPI00295B5F71|nr:phosphatidylinositol N-acetylglucosaminyltransferase subunit C-like [Ruditapes philippinarum]
MVDGIMKKWKKILYEDQGFPDHYVDDTFLDELKKNLHTRNYEYWKVVKESGVVTQQLCSVCIFVMVFIFMDVKVLAAETLVYISGGLTFIGYLANCLLQRDVRSIRTFLADLKTVMIFAGFSYCLSPVLVSLTETIATDTIYAMTTVMLLGNLCFHDYGADAEMVSGVLSLNAGLFASVCLASRLHTSHHSFATVTFAVELFALWPALRRNLRQAIPASHVAMTAILSLLTLVTLTYISMPAAFLLLITLVFITFVCPWWLITLQPYKNNIHGPWDEAVIKE